MNSTRKQHDDDGIYDGVLFGGQKNATPTPKPQTREKKSFTASAIVQPSQRSVTAEAKTKNVSSTVLSRTLQTTRSAPRANYKPLQTLQSIEPAPKDPVKLQQRTRQSVEPQQKMTNKQAYQQKVALHEAAQRASEQRRLEQQEKKRQIFLQQQAYVEQERARERELHLRTQKQLQQQKIAEQKKQQEILQQQQKIAEQKKQQEILRQQQNLREQRNAQRVKQEMLAKAQKARQESSHTKVQTVDTKTQHQNHLPQEKLDVNKWSNISTQGISLKEPRQRKSQERFSKNQVPKAIVKKFVAPVDKQGDTTKVSLPKAFTPQKPKEEPVLTAPGQALKAHRKLPKKILTQKSDSFFENIPDATNDTSAQKSLGALVRVSSLMRKLLPGSSKEQVVKKIPSQKNTRTRTSLFTDTEKKPTIADNPIRQASFRFATLGFLSLTAFGSLLFMGHALATKDRVEDSADAAIEKLQGAASFASAGDFQKAFEDIENAHTLFLQADEQISTINRAVVGVSRYIPGASKLASGDSLVSASVHISQALAEVSKLTTELDILQQAARSDAADDFSMLEVSERFFGHIKIVHEQLQLSNEHLARVHIDDVPEGQRDRFIQLRRTIEPLTKILEQTVELEDSIFELLGSEGSRKYLFLFQNNQEMRASGGFIGSYGFLDMNQGRIREFKIDGIYNPGGQLTDKVVPPRPIQKISAAWSLHDSNWWPDFPKSAEKAMDLYARTGGPSVDGVITVTPVIVERLLEVTGPITLPEHDVTFTAKNFVELTRQEVEVANQENLEKIKKDLQDQEDGISSLEDGEYDEEADTTQQEPKKILSDLMPVLMGELKKDLSREKGAKLLSVVLAGLNERHIMMYVRNEQVRSMIEKKKWGGRMLETQSNYLSVIHSNINGYKTDGVIDDLITHESQLFKDGRIVNRVTIERTHNGGETGWEWWDAVNANYMRVYVPKGSKLLSATGHTPEWHEPRLDYEALKFEVDPDVFAEESNVFVDPDSGTRVYADLGKTVFGNWVYVSPGEKVTVTYEYELPWNFTQKNDDAGTFSSYDVLYQKQAGSENSRLKSTMSLDENMEIIARIPFRKETQSSEISENVHEQDFSNDVYQGLVFRIN